MELKTIQKPVDVFLLPDGTYLPVADVMETMDVLVMADLDDMGNRSVLEEAVPSVPFAEKLVTEGFLRKHLRMGGHHRYVICNLEALNEYHEQLFRQVPVHDVVQTYNKLLDAVPDREKPASDTPLPEGSRKWYDRGNEAQEELWRHCT